MLICSPRIFGTRQGNSYIKAIVQIVWSMKENGYDFLNLDNY